MQSEDMVSQVRNTYKMLAEMHEAALLEQLSDSESKEIEEIIIEKHHELSHLITTVELNFLKFKECTLRMNERERMIYTNGVVHGRESALDWVLDDIDDILDID